MRRASPRRWPTNAACACSARPTVSRRSTATPPRWTTRWRHIEYLLKKGYPARQILLCGESAGGGLIYALCLKLRAQKLPLPCGLIAISPWSDLTQSGESYCHEPWTSTPR